MDDYEEAFRRDTETARTVYSSVRDEFHAWKAKNIEETWDRVFPSSQSSSSAVAQNKFQTTPIASGPIPEILSEGEDAESYVHHWTYDADGNMGPGERIPVVVMRPAEYIENPLHPLYQFVTPASRNIMARMIDIRTAAFLPFPEDPEFPREEYLSSFGGFQWQTDQRDPDGKIFSL